MDDSWVELTDLDGGKSRARRRSKGDMHSSGSASHHASDATRQAAPNTAGARFLYYPSISPRQPVGFPIAALPLPQLVPTPVASASTLLLLSSSNLLSTTRSDAFDRDASACASASWSDIRIDACIASACCRFNTSISLCILSSFASVLSGIGGGGPLGPGSGPGDVLLLYPGAGAENAPWSIGRG